MATAALPMLLVLVVACGGGDDDPRVYCSRGEQGVVVTLPLFAEMACTVGGDHVTVNALIPLEADPSSYQPPAEDAELITKARLVLYAGLGLHLPSQDFIFEHGRGSAQIIAFPRSVTSPTAQPPEGEEPIDAQQAGDNPYLWLDPELAKVYIDVVRDSLEIVDAKHIQDYRAEAEAYIARIEEVNQEILAGVAAIPAENRKLVTLHDSMPHFARRYGFEVVGFLADPAQAPTPDQVQTLVEQVRQSGAKAVFTERGYDDAAMRQVAQQASVPLCSLYTDRVDAGAMVYTEIMRANLAELVGCLS